jgi:hypothetical protein
VSQQRFFLSLLHSLDGSAFDNADYVLGGSFGKEDREPRFRTHSRFFGDAP